MTRSTGDDARAFGCAGPVPRDFTPAELDAAVQWRLERHHGDAAAALAELRPTGMVDGATFVLGPEQPLERALVTELERLAPST